MATFTKNKYGVQITVAEDGAWSVYQLVQKGPGTAYTSTGGIIFVDHSKPTAAASLLEAINKGLEGKIKGTTSV